MPPVIARGGTVVAAVVTSICLPTSTATAADCAADATAASLDAFFGADDAAGLAGADGPKVTDLQDGRFLWLFQDNFRGDGTNLAHEGFAHNRALVQTGNCFELLDDPGGPGNSWIGSWVETIWVEWFWPLDAEIGADGHLYVFLAYMRDPTSTRDGRGAQPVEAWRARYTLPDLEFVDLEPATDPSSSLFGYSIVSDETWSYLYGNCHRHFLEDTELGFDETCSPHAYLARVPRGQFDDAPEYWTGSGWSSRRDDRRPVLTGEDSMPLSVERFGNTYVAAADEGDWYGSDLVIRTASRPEGPWTEVVRYTPATKCGERCNNYAAVVFPKLQGDKVVVALSNNAWVWDEAVEQASVYRIGLHALDVPGVNAAVAAGSPAAPADAAVAGQQVLAEPVGDATAADTTPPAGPGLTGSVQREPPLFAAVRTIVLVMSVLTIIAASVGLASMLRRSSRQRRSDALARLRTRGAVRRHCRPMPSGRSTTSPSGLGESVPDRRHVATARTSLTRSAAGGPK